MDIRYLKIAFAFCMALWSLVSTIGNFYALQGTYAACARVSSLTDVPPTVHPFFINKSAVLNWLATIGIIAGKAIATVFLILGTWDLWAARSASAPVFNAAKHWAIVGGWVNVLWLFVGFAFLGETVFYMFANPRGAGEANTAFRYTGYFGLILLFLGQAD